MKKHSFYLTYIATILTILLSEPLLGQTTDYRDLLRPNHITTSIDQQKAVFTIKSYDKKAVQDRTYHWYSTQKVYNTLGGYSGKVLDGSYTLYHRDNNLAQQGHFQNGLKTGIWKSWNQKGILEKESYWKKGLESGNYRIFGDSGQLLEQGKLVNGAKQGKIKRFEDGQTILSYYDQDKAIDKEQYIQQNSFRRSGKYIRDKWQKWFTKKDKPQD